MEDWDQFQSQMDHEIPEKLDINEICKFYGFVAINLLFSQFLSDLYRFSQRGKVAEHHGRELSESTELG